MFVIVKNCQIIATTANGAVATEIFKGERADYIGSTYPTETLAEYASRAGGLVVNIPAEAPHGESVFGDALLVCGCVARENTQEACPIGDAAAHKAIFARIAAYNDRPTRTRASKFHIGVYGE